VGADLVKARRQSVGEGSEGREGRFVIVAITAEDATSGQHEASDENGDVGEVAAGAHGDYKPKSAATPDTSARAAPCARAG